MGTAGFANPSFPTLWTPPFPTLGNPLRRGTLAAAVYTNLGSYIPVQIFNPHFDVVFGCFVFGLRSLAFQKISLGICLSFFIIGGMDCSCLRLRGVFAVVFRRICADRGWVVCFGGYSYGISDH